ncbi:hypothetical protein [Laceyella tengchongensis]|uniref:hypothetical protein n=1 Tax=Laceyella tengchongensis TaxID=574699 RepID=UPI0012B6DBEF|nr:hypothetical protein [Laceyella tengchongensis]
MIENKARPQFPYYSANTDKENVIWLLQAGLPMISPSSGKVVLGVRTRASSISSKGVC